LNIRRRKITGLAIEFPRSAVRDTAGVDRTSVASSAVLKAKSISNNASEIYDEIYIPQAGRPITLPDVSLTLATMRDLVHKWLPSLRTLKELLKQVGTRK
jgi:hypothetical protein